MSTDATTPVPVAPGRSALPQFDATREIPAADTTELPTAAAEPSPIAPPQVPYTYASAHPAPDDRTGAAQVPGSGAPVAEPPVAEPPAAATRGNGSRWSAKKTAVTAGLAIVLASVGAIGAAAAMPAGSTGDTGRFGRFAPGGQNGQNGFAPFGRGNHGFGGQGLGNQNGQQGLGNQGLGNQNGQQGLNNQGSQLPNLGGIDPNQLSQLDPQDLLNQLNQLTGGSDDSSSSTT